LKIGLQIPDFTWPGGAARLGSDLATIARTADECGFDSVGVMDHLFQIKMVGPPEREMLEAYTALGFLAANTSRTKLLAMVTGVVYRHPGMLAKAVTTLDVLSGGRAWLGIGAAWNEEESRGLGIPFPPLAERMGMLGDQLEVIRAMFGPGRATYEGRFAHVRGAINVPKGLQPHIPIIVGGNGARVTAGYAIRYADELNYVFLPASEIAERMTSVRARCEAEGRDPATLRFSLYCRDEEMRHAGQARVDTLAGFAAIGLDRLVCFPTRWSPTLDAQADFAEDCRAAGLILGD